MTTDMGAAATSALTGLHAQLTQLPPSLSSTQIWAMEGATIMNGIDDYPRKTEVTTVADAQDFAELRAVQRDEHALDVGDPARQRRVSWLRWRERLLRHHASTWEFSHKLEPFTGP